MTTGQKFIRLFESVGLEQNVVIIGDNGGGITLQLGRDYQHHYYAAPRQAAAQIADDITAYLETGDTSDWEGNEAAEHGWLEPSYEEERNGGYLTADLDYFRRTDPEDAWGNAFSALAAEIQKRRI